MKPSQINLLHIFLLICSAFIILFLSYQTHSQDKSTPPEFKQITNNWEQGAILDIAIASTCPTGYQEAFFYQWPGNPTRCFCGDLTFFTRVTYNLDSDVYPDACDANQIKAGCRNVERQAPVKVANIAKASGQGVTICVLRSSENWVTAAPNSDNPCVEAGTMACGRSRDSTFCTKEKKCPINDIQIVKGDVGSCKYENGCLVLSKEENLFVKFERGGTYDALPLAEFKLTEHHVCQDNLENNISPERQDYWALSEQRSLCEKKGKALWLPALWTLTEKDLFDLNGVTPKIDYYEQFDGYYQAGKSGADYNWNLYGRGYVPWAVICRNQMGILTESDGYLSKVTRAQKIQFYAVLLGTILFGVIAPYMLYKNKKSTPAKILNVLAKLAQGAVQIYAFKFVELIVNNLNSFNDSQCTSGPFLGLLKDGSTDIRSVYHYDIAGIVILAGMLVFDVGREVYLHFFTKEKYYPQVNIQFPSIRTGGNFES